jgi:hypothetical protein
MQECVDLFVRVQRFNGGNRLLSRDLRGALLTAGFVHAEVRASGEGYGTLEQTRRIAAAFSAIISSSEFGQTVLGQAWVTEAELKALPPALHAWAERPDAFIGVLKCGALAWTRGRQ